MRRGVIGLAVLLLLGACARGGPDRPALVVHADATGLQSFRAWGRELLRQYYVEGSCDGTDHLGANVTSVASDGRVLRPRGDRCLGAPYELRVRRLSPESIEVTIRVGPLVVPYASLGVSFDAPRDLFDHYQFAARGHHVGCARTWSARASDIGRLAEIPTPCLIPQVGQVGLARKPSRETPWVELTMPGLALRRSLVRGVVEWQVVRHPHTDSLQAAWVAEPIGVTPPLPAGRTVELVEVIEARRL